MFQRTKLTTKATLALLAAPCFPRCGAGRCRSSYDHFGQRGARP